MPLYHCDSCHHEWEGTDDDCICNWCGSDGYILEEKTPLEKMLEEIFNETKCRGV